MTLPNFVEDAKGAAVQIIGADDVIAGAAGVHHRVGGSKTRGKTQAVLATFEAGNAVFKGEACRIVSARVFKALMLARTTLRKGRGQVDGRHHRAGRRIGRLSSVNGPRSEAAFVAVVFVHLSSYALLKLNSVGSVSRMLSRA